MWLNSNLPEIAQGLTICLLSKSKHGKESKIGKARDFNDEDICFFFKILTECICTGKVFLSVDQLHSNKLMGEWYRLQKEHRHGAFATLTSLGTQGSDSIGSLRIGTKLEERVILPICSYKPLIDASTYYAVSNLKFRF